MAPQDEIAELLDRLARLGAARQRAGGLPEAQVAALEYLGRANRFSRSPSAVADYLAATRGTVSQTLIALARKGLVTEKAYGEDRRSRSYDLTADGRAELAGRAAEVRPWDHTDAAENACILDGLRLALRHLIAARGGRSFGQCRTCCHHRSGTDSHRCALLGLALAPDEAHQICREHRAA